MSGAIKITQADPARRKPGEAQRYAYIGSLTTPGKTYLVTKTGHTYRCTCPAFMFRGGVCKHISAFRAAERAR